MKLSEIKPCGSCGKQLASNGHTTWYAFCASAVILNERIARNVTWASKAMRMELSLAEACVPKSKEAVLIAGEENADAYIESHVCEECAKTKPLLSLMEAVRSREDQREAAAG